MLGRQADEVGRPFFNMSFEQIVRVGVTSASSPNWFELVVPITPGLRYRRLYVGGFWRGDVDDTVWTAKLQFKTNGVQGNNAAVNFAWRSKSGGTSFATVPIDTSNTFPVAPPFSVEVLDDIQLPQFPSAAPAGDDELITSHTDNLESRTRLCRMKPIPIFSDASSVLVTFRADYTSATGVLPLFTGVIGVRSSEVPL